MPDLSPIAGEENNMPASPELDYLTAVIETQRDIAAVELDPELVMDMILQRTRKLIGADGASIDFLEDNSLVCKAQSGVASPVGYRFALQSSLAGRCLESGEVGYCRDGLADPHVDRVACERFGTRSFVVVPLNHAGQNIGVLKVVSARVDAFVPRDIAALRLMAGLLSASICNAQEFAFKRRLLDEHSRTLEALRQSEQDLRAFFNTAAFMMGIVELTEDDVLHISVNPATAQLHERTAQMMNGRTARDLGMDEHVVALWRGKLQEALHTRAPVGFTYRHDGAGKARWLCVTVSVIGSGHAGRTRFSYVAEDVTARKAAEYVESDRNQTLEMVAQGRPLPEVLLGVARLVDRQIQEAATAVFYLDDGSVKVLAPGMPRPILQAVQRRATTLAAALCADGVGKGAGLCVTQMHGDAVWDNCREAAGHFQCCWSMPVRSSDNVWLGMLAVFARSSGQPTQLERHALDVAARVAQIAIEHRQMSEMLNYRIRHDVLTGLPNRILFEDRLQQALSMARRSGRSVALMVLDLDHFKDINDTYGHHAGDQLLQQFSQRVLSTLSDTHTLARVGGDEFVAVLPDLEDATEADAAARRIIQAMSEPFLIAGQQTPVTGSIGIAVFPRDAQDAATLQQSADAAMYAAKQRGRNRFISGLAA